MARNPFEETATAGGRPGYSQGFDRTRTMNRSGPPENIGRDRMGDRMGYGGMNKTVNPLYNIMAQQAGAFGGPQSYGGRGRQEQERPGPPNIGRDRMGGHGIADIFRDIRSGGRTFPSPAQQEEYQTAWYPGMQLPMDYGGSIGNRYGGNYEELETIPLDLQFDQFGNPIGNDDYGYFDDEFAARGGIMSLRR